MITFICSKCGKQFESTDSLEDFCAKMEELNPEAEVQLVCDNCFLDHEDITYALEDEN